jgi:hypothetical protein
VQDTHELYRAAIDAIGAKKVAHALGLSLSHTYRLQRPPMDESDGDGTGARSDADRIEMLVDVLAAHPYARPVLHRGRLHFDALFRRALDREDMRPLSAEALAAQVGGVCKEFGEFLRECGPMLEPHRVLKEGAEAIEAIERLIRAAQVGQ